ncbi:PRiA4b ORF-3-like protein [Candidatus Electrothrix aarhusensis]
MAKKTKSENVPKKMQETFAAISSLTDAFCKEQLNEEYAQLARYLTAALCRKRPSPLTRGKTNSWAGGVIYALGFVNFLFDKSQKPSLTAGGLCAGFGISTSNGASKSKQIRDLMDIMQFDPNWTLPSKMDDNYMAWMITVDGFAVDARSMPLHIQEVAYEKGFIPYIPGQMDEPKKDRATVRNALYTLEAFIIGGPLAEEFVENNPVIGRTVEIRGDQTLEDLHGILFKAFDREEEHLYEFQLKGAGPMDPENKKYISSSAGEGFDEPKPDGVCEEIKIGSLELEEGEAFAYWFDFGDDWWHQINVVSITEPVPDPKGKYPKIIKRKGDSPPQYLDVA